MRYLKEILIESIIIFCTVVIVSKFGIDNLFAQIMCGGVILTVIDIFRRIKKRDRKEKNK